MASLAEALTACIVEPPHEISPQRIEASACFSADYPGFSGHFPDNPVLPGIVQIMLARYVAALGQPAFLVRVKKSKFTRPVLPNEHVRVSAHNVVMEKSIESTVNLFVADSVCATVTLTITPQETT